MRLLAAVVSIAAGLTGLAAPAAAAEPAAVGLVDPATLQWVSSYSGWITVLADR